MRHLLAQAGTNINALRSQLGEAIDRMPVVQGTAGDVQISSDLGRHLNVMDELAQKRGEWLDALCERLEPSAEVGMEACTGAHHWARELQARGYVVKLIAAQRV